MDSSLASVGRDAIRDMATGIAHEFNNLNAAILGFAELARLQIQPEHPVQARLSRIIEAGRRAAALIELFSVFGERDPQVPRRIDLNRLVRDFDPVREGVPVDDLRIVTRIDPEPLWVFGDPGRIGVVLKNLVLDARSALSAGRQVILGTGRVSAGPLREREVPRPFKRPCAVISIKDAGKPIRGHYRLVRRDTAPSRSGIQTKPELPIFLAHEIIRRCGGILEVQGQPGMGVVMNILFPLFT
jgi:signal transduction histidine kinase